MSQSTASHPLYNSGRLSLGDIGQWLVAICAGLLVGLSLTALSQANAEWTASMWRVGSVVLALSLIIRLDLRRMSEFIGLFFWWLLAVGAESVLRFGELDSFAELFRHLAMFGLGAIVYQASGTSTGRGIARKFLWVVLIYITLMAAAAVPEVMAQGWSWDKARVFKAVMLHDHGIAFNSLLFMAVICLVSTTKSSALGRIMWGMCFGVLVLSSVIFATRAPFVAMLVAWVAVGGYGVWRKQSPAVGSRSATNLLIGAILLIPFVAVLVILAFPTTFLSRFAAGRLPLWQISLAEWRTSPVIGVGPNALKVGAARFLSSGFFSESYQRNTVLELTGGGFHNIWLDTMASKGVIGLGALFVSYSVLLRIGLRSVGIADARPYLVLLFMLLARSYVEVSGLFGYQNSPLDLIGIVALATTMRSMVDARANAGLPLPLKSG